MRIYILPAAILLAAPLFSSTEANPGVSGTYRCGPGDVLRVSVFEAEELSGSVTVSADGSIPIALIGDVPADGKTAAEIEAEIERRLSDNLLRNPQVAVQVKEFRSQPVSVLGAVEEPGIYQLMGSRRLLDVIAMAGGFSQEAGEDLTISRKHPELGVQEFRIALKPLLTRRPSELNNREVKPHDRIRVSQAGVVYVLGSVERPGGFPIQNQEPLTVLRAVSLAAGTKKTAALQRARVISPGVENAPDRAAPLKDLLNGRQEDFALQPNDILFVPDSGSKTALHRGSEAIIQMATGLVIWRR